MPNKTPYFDWSMLDRKSLQKIPWVLYPFLLDKKLKGQEIHLLISKNIKKQLPIRISKKFDGAVEQGKIYIGGTYYSDYDENNQKCIELVLIYNPFDEFIKFNKRSYKKFCQIFADTILDEMIHMRLYRRRKFKILPDYEINAEKSNIRKEQSYLGNSDEIDAYSFNIACELLDKFKNKTIAIEYLGKKHRKGHLRSPSLRAYLKAFEYDNDHIIIKKLKKRVIGYLPNAELGKPYRSKDWINW